MKTAKSITPLSASAVPVISRTIVSPHAGTAQSKHETAHPATEPLNIYIHTLGDLYTHQLRDILSCETQLHAALPTLMPSVASQELTSLFQVLTDEAEEHVVRLNRILEALATLAASHTPPNDSTPPPFSIATQALIHQSGSFALAIPETSLREASLICTLQKLVHHKISSYGSLISFANLLKRETDARLLQRNLQQERQGDENLTILAVSAININAVAA